MKNSHLRNDSQMDYMQTRKARVIKQNDPLNNRDGNHDYVCDHEKSLINLLVPRHVEYTQRVLEKAVRRSGVPVQEIRTVG